MADEALVSLRRHAEMAAAIAEPRFAAAVEEAAVEIAERLGDGGQLIAFGNGGSAADAQHVVAELTGRYLLERRPLPAVALAENASSVTAIANDYGFEEVFARQVRGLGRPGDVALALSTSGASANVTAGLRAAREVGMLTVAVTGPGGERIRDLCDRLIVVPAGATPQVQEGTIVVLHVICEVVELRLFGP